MYILHNKILHNICKFLSPPRSISNNFYLSFPILFLFSNYYTECHLNLFIYGYIKPLHLYKIANCINRIHFNYIDNNSVPHKTKFQSVLLDDSQFSWVDQIDFISNKIKRNCFVLKRFNKSLSLSL